MTSFIALLLMMVIYGNVGQDQEYVYMYNTDDSHSTEKFHCVYHGSDNIPFCRRSPDIHSITPEFQEKKCHNGGQLWNFSALVAAGIEPYDVVKWASSIEKADDYAAYYYYYNQSIKEFTTDSFLCDCSITEAVFGKFCDYRLLYGAHSIQETLDDQFSYKKDYWPFQQLNGRILCYTTLKCDSGALCLEWRDICNGHQNCMDGWDEINCDILEFYECDENEYRCSNGLCIPDVYFLDGKIDTKT